MIWDSLSHDLLTKSSAIHKSYNKSNLLLTHAPHTHTAQAYRKAALRYHPDKQASKGDDEKALAEKMFREIGEAYEVLSDPEKKKKYDEGVDVEVSL